MRITFYFDPFCPFSWITSRWLLVVQNQTPSLNIDWAPFSLAIKNNELAEKPSDNQYVIGHRQSLRVLRIMLAAEKQHNRQLIDMYSAFGTRKHIMFEEFTDDNIEATLAEIGLPLELIKAANSSEHDAKLRQYIDQATSIVGKNTGVPTTVFTLDDDSQQGYFGPVLQSLPSKADSLKIWQGISSLAAAKEFYELKRNRPADDPDTANANIAHY